MENEETFNSKTSFIVNDGREGFQKWNGDQWEQVHFSGCSEEEMEDIESGLPMKVLKFMGLPKSYRHTLYNEFVQDVSLIPTETASSLKNIVSWICGQNEDGRSKNAKRSSMGQGDTSSQKYIMVNTTSSSESIGSTDSRVFRTDSMTNLKLITPFGVVVERKKSEKKPVQLLEAIELPSNISIATSMHELALEEKKEPQAHILELDHNGNVVRIPTRRPCASETSLYGCVMSETESEAEVSCKSAGTTPIVQSEKEDEGEGEEVKRVTFAPSSETNIYAYHDGDETEEDAESKMSHSEIDREENEENDGQENHQDAVIKSEEQDNVENQNQEHDNVEPQTEIVLETPAASIKSCTSLHRVAVAKKKVSEEKIHTNDKPRSAAFSAWPHTNKENDSSLQQKNPPSTVSEAQLQLNKDLKTLEEIVKKLYKNLNKKGPVTIVANFKPKKDGELALDMGGSPNPQGTILKKSRDSIISISHETEDEQKEHVSAKVSEAEIENVSSKTKENQNNCVRASRSRSRMTVPPKQPPVGIMKNSSKPATTQQQSNSCSMRAHKPLSNLTKPPAIAPRLNKVTVNKVTVDKNNNIVEEPALKPALRHKSKMPSLRPAASSHSVSRTALVNKAEVHASPSRSSRSKHYLVRTSSSQHAIMEKPATQQHYKIVEASNSKRYLVPVTPPRTSSQQVLVETSPSQHLLLEPPNSNSQHILLESPLSQPIFLENLQQNQQVIREPQRPIQHILVETPPPPTCQNPHLHPRTATIIPPPSANTQFHGTSTPTISQSHQQSTYRYIQPCSMHSKYNHHPPQQQTSWSQHNLHDESAEETGSNTSRVSSASSTFSGVNGNYNSNSNTAPSGGETGTEEGIPIPIRITAKTVPASSSHHFQEQRQQQQQQQQRSVTARKPSIMLNTRQKQSTENVMASSSGTNKQYRTTVHIPTGPPKPNSYRAIFKEKQQQQKQTVYVDLTSKGMRKNR